MFSAMPSMGVIVHRFGKRSASADEEVEARANTVQGSMLGVLAQLTGFLCSLALA